MLPVFVVGSIYLTLVLGFEFSPSQEGTNFYLHPATLTTSEKQERIQKKQEEMERQVSTLSDRLTTILNNVSALKDQQSEKENSLRNEINKLASKMDNVTTMFHSTVQRLSEEMKHKDEETKKSLELIKQQTDNLTKMVDKHDSEEAAAPHTCDHGNYTLLQSVNMCIRLSASTDTRSWYESKERCQSEDGRLVNLDSINKQEAVVKYLNSIGDKAGTNNYRIWVGMKKIQALEFKWTGHGNTSDLKWDEGEPDNLDYQDVVQLTPGGLSDIPSYNKRRYMCEIVLA